MKVILLRDVAKVGRAYEIKDLADGYAKNFIIARGLGKMATPENIKKLNAEKTQLEAGQKAQAEKLQTLLTQLQNSKIVIKAKANTEGHLFAKVHESEIAQALESQAGIELPASSIVLTQPLKNLGSFEIKVKAGLVTGSFPLEIVALVD